MKVISIYPVCCIKCGDNISNSIEHKCYANGQSFTKYYKKGSI